MQSFKTDRNVCPTGAGVRSIIAIAAGIMGWCSVGIGQTDWSPPRTIGTTAGTSATILTGSVLAAGADGKLAAVWAGHWGETSGTFSNQRTIRRHSDVYASYSFNKGTSWTSHQMISNPRMLNSQPYVTNGGADEFSFLWTSGDSFSGFKLHDAVTTNAGISLSTHTLLQDYEEADQGFLYPKIIRVGPNDVLARSSSKYDAARQTGPAYLSVSPAGLSNWTDVVIADVPTSSLVYHRVQFTGSMAAAGTDVVAPVSVSYLETGTTASQKNKVSLLISRDSGLNWQLQDVPQPSGRNTTFPSIGNDSNGTWLLFSLGYIGFNFTDPQLYVQKSTDAAAYWSEPVVVPNGFPVKSVSGDGRGRWIALLGNRYIWSANNGDTWSPITMIPGTSWPSQLGETCVYMGNARWGVTWTDSGTIKFSELTWGTATVKDRELF